MNRATCTGGPVRKVTVTFDAENLVDTLQTLLANVCPGNLRPLGLALVDAAPKEKP